MIKTIRYTLQYRLTRMRVYWWKKQSGTHSSIGLQEWECTDDKNNQVHTPYKNEGVLMIKTIRYTPVYEWECTDDKNNQVLTPV